MNDPSRRDLFRQAGAASAVAAMTGAQLVPSTEALAQPHVAPIAPPQLEALESLTALEADALQAVVARLIPADENGPGAAEAALRHDGHISTAEHSLQRQQCRSGWYC